VNNDPCACDVVTKEPVLPGLPVSGMGWVLDSSGNAPIWLVLAITCLAIAAMLVALLWMRRLLT
jgi:hypothetical protein